MGNNLEQHGNFWDGLLRFRPPGGNSSCKIDLDFIRVFIYSIDNISSFPNFLGSPYEEAWDALKTGKVDVDLKGRNVQTPLSWAAQNGQEVVTKLLQSHTDTHDDQQP